MSGDSSTQSVWCPIEPLSERDLAIDLSEFNSVARTWLESKSVVEQQNPKALNDFYDRLRRSWSIETGILENLYMLDRGTTLTLIDRGFHQELVNRADTDIEPGRLVGLLKDHLAAGEMLQDLIGEQRALTAHFMREIHALLMRHQEVVEAEDSLGNVLRVEPRRGQWKEHNNWRELADGKKRSYCPPEQVPGQIEELLGYLEHHERDGVNACLLAAWLHHRFVVIHPFQDGNGRVARALVNYLFIKNQLFPVVVDRDQKSEYLDALETADSGDLTPLAGILATKQIAAIKQALSLIGGTDQPVHDPLIGDLARGIIERMRRREAQQQLRFRGVDVVMSGLAEIAEEHLHSELQDFQNELRSGGLELFTHVDSGGTHDGREHYYRWQIIESVRQAQQWANFNEQVRWARILARSKGSELRVVFSFHHVGQVLTGVAEVTSIADLQDVVPAPLARGRNEEEVPQQPQRRPISSMLQPFSFTWQDDTEALRHRFERWCSESLLVALREWSETL